MVLELTKTGKILRRILGPLYDEIYFDNANPNHGWHRRHQEKPDVDHIKQVLREQRPKHIVCFGGMAATGVEAALKDTRFLPLVTVHCYPHPQARGLTKAAWDEIGTQVKKFAMAN